MYKSLLSMCVAASFVAASCTQDKPAAVDAATTPAADTAVVVSDGRTPDSAAEAAANDTTQYRTEADRLASRIAEDLKLTDTVVVTRIEKTYYTRGRRLNEINTSYSSDTTGRYAAMRSVNDETDRSVKTIVTNPEQYRTYAANRSAYYEGTPYSNATISTTRESATPAPARRRGPAIVKYESKNGNTTIKYANGKTVKVDKDGDRKIEYPNGTKVKRDADDGEVKVKD